MDLLVKLMHGSVVEYNHGFDVHEPPKIPIIRSNRSIAGSLSKKPNKRVNIPGNMPLSHILCSRQRTNFSNSVKRSKTEAVIPEFS